MPSGRAIDKLSGSIHIEQAFDHQVDISDDVDTRLPDRKRVRNERKIVFLP
jgi:hypothetical protein